MYIEPIKLTVHYITSWQILSKKATGLGLHKKLMKKFKLHLLLLIYPLSLLSCGGSEEAPTTPGRLQLSEVIARLDGNDITSIPITTFVPNFEETSFTYNTDQGAKTGIWGINEAQTELSVEYEGSSYKYTLLDYSKEEFSFMVKSIDLKNALTVEEQNIILTINQKLLETKSSWTQVMGSSQQLEIIFTLKYK